MDVQLYMQIIGILNYIMLIMLIINILIFWKKIAK
jgi:hypothetical protein